MKITIQYILVALLLLGFNSVKAQSGEGSMTVDQSTVNIPAGSVEQRFSEGTYFGPGANWEINGVLEIYSKNVWIAPGARFSGSGKVVIYNPGSNPYYPAMASGPTHIDGNNGNFIDLILEHRNTENILLTDVADPGYGTNNPNGASAAALNIAGTLDLAGSRANIILNGQNLAFNGSGRISGYGRSRMVITGNSVAGHMIKDFGVSDSFVFPVGIEEGDYTPATLTPNHAGKLYVSVQNFAGANKAVRDPSQGMDRVWHIWGTSGIPSLYANMVLQHNISSNGILFKDEDAAIVRYLGGDKWDLVKGTNPSIGVHTRNNVSITSDIFANGGYFTKLPFTTTGLMIPNVYTPNGDGTNDTFVISGLEMYPENSLVIFNRWGNEVYRRNQYQNDWSGDGLNEGTYYYLLKIKETENSEWKSYKGFVTLLRAFKK